MVNISHELRTPLTLIYAPLKRLLKSIEHHIDDLPHPASLQQQTIQLPGYIFIRHLSGFQQTFERSSLGHERT